MSGAMKLPTAEEILANCRVIERETANLAKIAHEAVSDTAKLRELAQRLAQALLAVHEFGKQPRKSDELMGPVEYQDDPKLMRAWQKTCYREGKAVVVMTRAAIDEARAAGLPSVPLEGK